jgi:hypothetical protein
MPHACASAAAATAGWAGPGRGRGVARQAGGGVRVVWGREREGFTTHQLRKFTSFLMAHYPSLTREIP